MDVFALLSPAFSAYERLAPFYDGFTADHDYEGWTSTLERVLRRNGLMVERPRLLDVACGTGKSFEPFLARGWEVVACDLSPGMIEVARTRAGERVDLHVADMRELPVLGRFDVVTCLDDAVNYLVDPGDLVRAFRSARRQLRDGGLYLFDTNTLLTYRTTFAGEFAAPDGARWIGHGDGKTAAGALTTASIEIEHGGEVVLSEHVQRHHPVSAVQADLRRAGLQPLAVYGQLPDGTLASAFDELAFTKAIHVATTQRRRR